MKNTLSMKDEKDEEKVEEWQQLQSKWQDKT